MIMTMFLKKRCAMITNLERLKTIIIHCLIVNQFTIGIGNFLGTGAKNETTLVDRMRVPKESQFSM